MDNNTIRPGDLPYLQPGTILHNEYELVRQCGEGGFGEVWKARDIDGDRYVALKFISDRYYQSEKERNRVKETFQKIHDLSHQHIRQVSGLKLSETFGPYLVMQWLEGCTLRQLMNTQKREGRLLPYHTVHKILSDVAEALDYAHYREIVHRDVKPENIFLQRYKGNYEAKIFDFGIAAIIQESDTITTQNGTTGNLGSGSPRYMAPEQWKGSRHLDGRTDQYALAVIAYELLSGELPFSGGTREELKNSILKDTPKTIDGVSSIINDAVQRALSKEKSDRFSYCEEFVNSLDLERLAEDSYSEEDTVQMQDDEKSDRFSPHEEFVYLELKESAEDSNSEEDAIQMLDDKECDGPDDSDYEMNENSSDHQDNGSGDSETGLPIVAGMSINHFLEKIRDSETESPSTVTMTTLSGHGSFAPSTEEGNVSEDTNYDEDVRVLFEGTKLICFPNKGAGSYTIPDFVTEIGDAAFQYCDSLTEIHIPNSVTKIGDHAFHSCSSLLSVPIPDSVTKIGNYAFYRCEKLVSIPIANSVTTIGDYAFAGCTSLKSFRIPDLVTDIGGRVFMNCSELQTFYITDSVTKIGNRPFFGCRKLRDIIVSPKNKQFHDEDGVLIEGTTLQVYPPGKCLPGYRIPGYITKIGSYAFEGASLTSVEISNSITEISDYAFYRCFSLETIEISDSVTKIGRCAFFGCLSLTSIQIPNSVTEIGPLAFQNCSSMKSVEISGSVTRIDSGAFLECHSLTEILVSPDNPNYYDIDGVLFEGTKLLIYPVGKTLEKYIIPDSTAEISNDAFANCSSLRIVVIPDTVTKIGDGAFACCHLTSVDIPNSVTKIGDGAFEGCLFLSSVYIPRSVTEIGIGAFLGCISLLSVEIPDSVTEISDNTFFRCADLRSVEIPDTVTKIGKDAFQCCSRLKSVHIPDSVTEIGSGAFTGCSSLKTVHAPKHLDLSDAGIPDSAKIILY